MPYGSFYDGVSVQIGIPGQGEANAYSVTVIVPLIPS
jgi:hypothetical protein